MGRWHVGTSVWDYAHWKGVFYPPGLRPAEWLAYYAGRFASVELNNSFYRLPTEESFLRWRQQTPPGFLFAVKATRYLTHLKNMSAPALPRHLVRTGGFVCLRMHGAAPEHDASYPDGELAWWIEWLVELRGSEFDTYVYFNNDYKGHAVRNAERFMQLLPGG